MMKRYFKNLWMALRGRNPYQQELDDARECLESTAEKVRTLESLLSGFQTQMANMYKSFNDYQRLVENLRQRVEEKETELKQLGKDYHERMEWMKADYQRRIGEYNTKIDQLQNKK